MKFTDLFIRRPVLAMVVSLVILIAGLQSIRSLSVRQYPRSDIAVLTVTTAYVGANADLVRGFITTSLERVIASADGIDYIESSSAQGLSTITVHLKLNYDTNAALTQVQAKVAQVRNDLRPEAQAPVIELETADSRFAAMYLGFSSSDLDQNQITDYLTRVVQPKLSSIDGVQRAEILGGRTFAMRVWLKPEKMAAMGISASQVRDALADNNYLSTLGQTKGSMVSVNLVANTDLKTPEEFRRLVVKQDKGAVVRLGDISDVSLGAENYEQDVRFDGQGAVFMGVWVLPTANTLELIRRVREALPAIQADLPVGMKAGVPYDSTEYIESAIHEVLKTLTETLLIVILVIFLFLGSVRAVIIPIVAIPISLIGAVFLMLIAGFTINLLTLLAIVLSVGLVVDDAIVMVENVERHLRAGATPFRAAIQAARELLGPIIAMTLTLAAVYTPVAIQGGLTGTLFREFAFTLAGAVIVSGVVALTLSPMMGSKLLRSGDEERGFSGWINRRFDALRESYRRRLGGTLQYPPVVYALWAIVDLLIASTAEPKELDAFADSLVMKAYASGMFMYADKDLKFDQPQTEVVFDHDKVRSQGVDMSQAGQDLSTLLGGNFVNRFSIQGRSYKVIPQVKRSERLTPDQLKDIYVSGKDGGLVPLSTFATLRTSTEPRELKRFQQLNAVRIQGVVPPGVSVDQALSYLENQAKGILPRGFTLDYAGESRQLRTEGGRFLGIFLLSAILIFLVLAAQFESFRDPFVILAGSAPLAIAGALLFSFLGLTTLNIYSQVGLI